MKTSLVLPFRLLLAEPRLLARFAATSVGRAALTAASILLIREFLGAALGASQGRLGGVVESFGPGTALWTTAGLLLVAYLGAAALNYDARVTEQKIVKVIELGMMERLIRHLLELSLGFLDRRTHGDLIESVRRDVSQLRTAALAAANILLEAVTAAGLVLAAVSLSPWLALWGFLVVPLAALPVAVIARRTMVRSFGVRRQGVALFDLLLQLLRGMRIIKIYQGESAEARRTTERARRYFDELIAMERVRAMARVVLESLSGLSLIAVIIVGGFQVMAGQLGWPELLAVLMAARAAQGPFNNLNTYYMEIQRSGASVEQIDALLREQPEIRDEPGARCLPSPPQLVAADRLSFVRGGVSILQDVSFEARAGETLGIVGPSGAGKTTLLNLITRFYDPTSGGVLFDSVDARRIRVRDLHGALAIVTQDPFLFATSIRDNIRCGRQAASDDEVETAAKAAEIHDDIMAMRDGYETVVGHGGRELSRGEAQRVNIARAVLKNAPVLLLDEATSSLDSHAEARVQRALDRLAAGRLTISVAHRLSTLRGASRILVLESGRVAGFGPHAELLDRCPAYRRLWHAQAAAPTAPATAPPAPAAAAAEAPEE